MSVSRYAALLTAAFMGVSGAAQAGTGLTAPQQNTGRYQYLDGSNAGMARGSAGKTETATDYFYSYVYDTQNHETLLCAGVRVTLPEGEDASKADPRSTSRTLGSLWRKVKTDQPNVAAYGSCIQASIGELKKQNVEFMVSGGGTSDDVIIFKQDPATPANSYDYQLNLLKTKYPELLDHLGKGKRWPEFVAEAKQYEREHTYGVDRKNTCANAGYFQEESLDILRGTFTGTLPVCPRTYPKAAP